MIARVRGAVPTTYHKLISEKLVVHFPPPGRAEAGMICGAEQAVPAELVCHLFRTLSRGAVHNGRALKGVLKGTLADHEGLQVCHYIAGARSERQIQVGSVIRCLAEERILHLQVSGDVVSHYGRCRCRQRHHWYARQTLPQRCKRAICGTKIVPPL